MIPLTGGLAAVLLSTREFPPQSRWLCLVLEPPQLSEGSLCAFCLPKRSGFISVAVLKHSNWKQLRRGKGLFSLQFRGAAHPSSWEVKAGTESAGHITPRVKSRKKRTHTYLPFAVLLYAQWASLPYCPGPPAQGMAPPTEGLPKPSTIRTIPHRHTYTPTWSSYFLH